MSVIGMPCLPLLFPLLPTRCTTGYCRHWTFVVVRIIACGLQTPARRHMRRLFVKATYSRSCALLWSLTERGPFKISDFETRVHNKVGSVRFATRHCGRAYHEHIPGKYSSLNMSPVHHLVDKQDTHTALPREVTLFDGV